MSIDWASELSAGLKELDDTLATSWTTGSASGVGRWGAMRTEVEPGDAGFIRNSVRSLTIRKSVYSTVIPVNTEVTKDDGSKWRVRGSFAEDDLSRTYDLLRLT